MQHPFVISVILMMSLWITTVRAQSEGDSSDTTKWRMKNLVENVKTKFEQDSQELAKSEDEIFRYMDDLPPFSIYKDNYFIRLGV